MSNRIISQYSSGNPSFSDSIQTQMIHLYNLKKYGIPLVLCLIHLFLFHSRTLGTVTEPGFIEQKLADGLNPVAMTIDHHGRVWLAEKHGVVSIMDTAGNFLPDPVIQINVDDFNERGLLGIALHPDFETTPYLYLCFTRPDTNINRISRFLINGDLAVPGSEEIIFDLHPLPGTVHNGGSLIFDNDGKLFVTTGEASFPPHAQNTGNLHGKILRLNEDGTIPADNPFYNTFSGPNRAIWSLGLRNPFSIAYDPFTGQLLVGDVGAGLYEEINEILPGKNYGWPLVEGPLNGQNPPADYQEPLYAYGRSDGCAIVGAAYYYGSLFPEKYHGAFFNSDYCEGKVIAMNPQTGTQIGVFASDLERPVAIAIDAGHEVIYYLTRGPGGGSPNENTRTQIGELWKIQYTGNGIPFISVHPEDKLIPQGEDAIFEIKALGSAPLSFQWQKNGLDIPGADSTKLVLAQVSISDHGNTYRCIISNNEGSDTSQTATLSVTLNQRPQPVILEPGENQQFRAGETIIFHGEASDPEEGALSPQALSWRVDWHHDDHTHPGYGPVSGLSQGQFQVPVVTETDTNVWYRIYLAATDSGGLVQTTFRDIFPRLVPGKINGPAGLKINIDGRIRELPYEFKSLSGIQRVVLAPETHILGNSIYYFQGWEDGHTSPEYSFLAPDEGIELGLVYESFSLGTGTGLWGEYFDDPELDLDGTPVVERLDPVINFQWGGDSPDPQVPADYFTGRWTGEIQSVFEGEYTFYVTSDDGCRLWVNDSLLIDQWVPQATTELQGRIFLEKGKRYHIRLEYMEIKGGAELSMAWSHPRILKEIIPRRQMYPPPFFLPASISGKVWLDENDNQALDLEDSWLKGVTVLLKSAEDSSTHATSHTDAGGNYRFDLLPEGFWFLQFLSHSTGENLEPGAGLNLLGATPVFLLEQGQEWTGNFYFRNLGEEPRLTEVLSDISVYPVPAEDQITASFTLGLNAAVVVSMLDRRGALLYRETIIGTKGLNTIEISTRNLSPGVYHLRVLHPLVSGGKTFLKR